MDRATLSAEIARAKARRDAALRAVRAGGMGGAWDSGPRSPEARHTIKAAALDDLEAARVELRRLWAQVK